MAVDTVAVEVNQQAPCLAPSVLKGSSRGTRRWRSIPVTLVLSLVGDTSFCGFRCRRVVQRSRERGEQRYLQSPSEPSPTPKSGD